MSGEHVLEDFPSIFSLKGKIAVVTGGSRGLGLQAASGLLQAGCSKVFISSRKKDVCDEACKALNALPNLAPSAVAISAPADSSTAAGVASLVKIVKEHTDKVDILVANAGATWGEPIDTHPDSAFAKVMNLNVRGVFNAIQQFLPFLEEAGKGPEPSRIIITGSIAGIGRGPYASYGYAASKAAVMHMARNMALELGPRHITINSIAPGFFPSQMTKIIFKMGGGVDAIGKSNPMRRLGKGEDMAGTVVFLASRAASHINGTNIVVDGGATLMGGELDDSSKAKL